MQSRNSISFSSLLPVGLQQEIAASTFKQKIALPQKCYTKRGTLGICGVVHFFMRCCGRKNPSLWWSQALGCAMFAFLSLRYSVKRNYLQYSCFHNFWTNDFPKTFFYLRGSSNFSTQLGSHFHCSSSGKV